MRVLIVSDTHGRHGNLDRALKKRARLMYLSILGMLKEEKSI